MNCKNYGITECEFAVDSILGPRSSYDLYCISAVQLVYHCTDLYNVSTRYTSVPAFCCTLQECVLQEACMLSSNMVDFSMKKMNKILNNEDSYLPCYLSLLVEGGEGERSL